MSERDFMVYVRFETVSFIKALFFNVFSELDEPESVESLEPNEPIDCSRLNSVFLKLSWLVFESIL